MKPSGPDVLASTAIRTSILSDNAIQEPAEHVQQQQQLEPQEQSAVDVHMDPGDLPVTSSTISQTAGDVEQRGNLNAYMNSRSRETKQGKNSSFR